MAFVDRVVEYPNRYQFEDENGVRTGPYTLVRDEGTVTEAGTPLDAANLTSNVVALIDPAHASIADFFTVQAVTLTQTVVAANSYSALTSHTITIPAGYTKCVLAIPAMFTNHNIYLWSWTYDDTSAVVTYRFHNVSGSALTITPSAVCLFVK